jgi:hypothetical protein
MDSLELSIFAATTLETQRLIPFLLLTAALAVVGTWAWSAYRDLKGAPEEACPGPGELLTPLSNAFAAGYMSPDEYERVRESAERSAGGQPSNCEDENETKRGVRA